MSFISENIQTASKQNRSISVGINPPEEDQLPILQHQTPPKRALSIAQPPSLEPTVSFGPNLLKEPSVTSSSPGDRGEKEQADSSAGAEAPDNEDGVNTSMHYTTMTILGDMIPAGLKDFPRFFGKLCSSETESRESHDSPYGPSTKESSNDIGETPEEGRRRRNADSMSSDHSAADRDERIEVRARTFSDGGKSEGSAAASSRRSTMSSHSKSSGNNSGLPNILVKCLSLEAKVEQDDVKGEGESFDCVEDWYVPSTVSSTVEEDLCEKGKFEEGEFEERLQVNHGLVVGKTLQSA